MTALGECIHIVYILVGDTFRTKSSGEWLKPGHIGLCNLVVNGHPTLRDNRTGQKVIKLVPKMCMDVHPRRELNERQQ